MQTIVLINDKMRKAKNVRKKKQKFLNLISNNRKSYLKKHI